MLRQYLVLLFLCVSLSWTVDAFSQAFGWESVKMYGTNQRDEINDAIQLADGSVIAVGTTTGSGTTGNLPVYPTRAVNKDALILHFDSLGNHLHSTTYGGTWDDEFQQVLQLNNGNLLALGTSNSDDMDVWGVHNNPPFQLPDIWIVCMDMNLDTLWTRPLGSFKNDRFGRAVVQKDGNIMIYGTAFEATGDVTRIVGGHDMWFARIDPNGVLLQQFTLGATGHDFGDDILELDDGGFMALGRSRFGDTDFSGQLGNSQDSDWRLVRLDSIGAKLWDKPIGGSLLEFEDQRLIRTSDGNLLIAGGSRSIDSMMTGNYGSHDLHFLKMDTAGNLLWSKQYGSDAAEPYFIFDIKETADSGFLFAGTVNNYGSQPNNDIPRFLFAGEDIWVLHTDAAGNVIHSMTFGGVGHDRATAVLPIDNDRFSILGHSTSRGINMNDSAGTTSNNHNLYFATLGPCAAYVDSFHFDFCSDEVYFHPLIGTGTAFIMDTTIVDSFISTTGCDSTVFTVVDFHQRPVVSAYTQDANCGQSNGLISLTVDSVPNPVFIWSTGDTTAFLTAQSLGNYEVVISNPDGCSDTFQYSIQEIGAPRLYLDSAFQADCNGDSGYLAVYADEGIIPYTYQWSNGSTSAVQFPIAAGWYSVTVTDISGCRRHVNFQVVKEDSCEGDVFGSIYLDKDSNCIIGPNDVLLPGFPVEVSNGQRNWTDSSGAFHFKLPAGSYSINALTPPQLIDHCNPGAQISAQITRGTDTLSGRDIPLKWTGLQSLIVQPNCGRARVNTTQFNTGTILNFGPDTATASVTFTYDSLLGFSYSRMQSSMSGDTLVPVSVDTALREITYIIPMQPLEVWNYFIHLHVPGVAVAAPGTDVCLEIEWIPTHPGSVLSGDEAACCKPIRASYDPNEKTVSPDPDDGKIYAADSLLTYTIYFQNTGNDTAYDVVILDTLDATYLDLSTFQLGAATHNYTASFLDSNIVEFRFAGIYLPDSGIDNPGSNGHVWFTIETLGGLLPDDEIANSAGIYFDYNPPIITNTVISVFSVKISDSTGTFIDPKLASQISVYPNPNSGEQLFIETGSVELKWYELISLDGRIVQSGILEPLERNGISVRDVGNGVYLLQLGGDELHLGRMIVIQR